MTNPTAPAAPFRTFPTGGQLRAAGSLAPNAPKDQVELAGRSPQGEFYSPEDLAKVFGTETEPEVPTFNYQLVKWSAKIPKGGESSAGVGPEGQLYFSTKNGVAALDSEGNALWVSSLNYPSPWATPAVGSDGTVFAVSKYRPDGPGLVALSPQDGSIQWEGRLKDFQASPTVGPDDSIFAGDYRGNVVAFNPDRSERWRAELGHHVTSKPTVGPRGDVYVVADPGRLHAFSKSGEVKWTETDSKRAPASGTSVTVLDDGNLLLTTGVCWLRKVTPNGDTIWEFSGMDGARIDLLDHPPSDWGNGSLSTTPRVSPDQKAIYVGGRDGVLMAFNQEGERSWQVETGLSMDDNRVQVGEDGTIYATCRRHGTLRAFDPQGRNIWNFQPKQGGKASVTSRGDMVYLSTDGGEVHALSNQSLIRLAQHQMKSEAAGPPDPVIEFGEGELTVGDFNLPVFD